MKEILKRRGIHALLSALLSIGLVMPVLGILDRSFISSEVLLPLFLTVLCFELAASHKIASFASVGAAVAALVLWLAALGGQMVISDVLIATSLRLSGVSSSMPLVASQVVWCCSVLITLVACFSCLKNATCFPSVMLCIAVALAIYLTGSDQLILWLLPALVAMLLMILTDRFQETPVISVIPWAAVILALSFLFSGTVSNPFRVCAGQNRKPDPAD